MTASGLTVRSSAGQSACSQAPRRGVALDMVLRHQWLTLLITATTLGLTLWLYTVAPKGFLPQQDTGVIQGQAQAETDISFDGMSVLMQKLGAIIAAEPDVDNVAYWINPSPSASVGQVQINLKPSLGGIPIGRPGLPD